MMAIRPDDRFQTPQAVMRALLPYLPASAPRPAGRPAAAPAPLTFPAARPDRRRFLALSS